MALAPKRRHDFQPPVDPARPGRRPLGERLWSVLIGGLVFITIFIAALPLFAIVRGPSAGIALFRAGNASLISWLGLELALVALGLGAFFFAYSLKYYLATATMLLLAFFGPGRKTPSPALPTRGRDDGLERITQRGLDGNLQPAWERRGRFDLGYEPFISIHIATYNEKRVIGRLLEACSKLHYSNYEVILVDDST